jgi:hypothetical protein
VDEGATTIGGTPPDRQVGVTVITPTVSSRAELLAEAAASVAAQTYGGTVVHAVRRDRFRRGPARTRNALLTGARTTWVAFLDDDDVLLPHHLELLVAEGERTDADVVGSQYRIEGDDAIHGHSEFDADEMRRGNYLPITVVARTDAVLKAGGFDPRDRYEDWGLWVRMLDTGATFTIVPEVTWVVRHRGDNRTFAERPTNRERVRFLQRRLRER